MPTGDSVELGAISADGTRQTVGLLARAFDDRGQHVLGLHAPPKVRIDEARLDAPVAPDDEGRRNGQEPAAISLELMKVDAELPVHLLDRVPNPEHEAERKGVYQVEVGQHTERRFPCNVRAYEPSSGTMETTSPPAAAIKG